MGKVLMSKKVSFYRSNGIVTYVQEYVGQTTFNLSFKSNCRLNTVMVDWAISLMISSQFNENLDWSIHETLNYFNILQTTIGNLLKCFRYHYRKYWKNATYQINKYSLHKNFFCYWCLIMTDFESLCQTTSTEFYWEQISFGPSLSWTELNLYRA